ncbi:C40 family peptidase [Sphaerisporangium perillae]|uniref:C40 family peptidase n=1 Tax=Sphaerisporangium perillae TaxID=2935860 RepID=UPI002010423B|nr:C40 family peptidase [Sphaerisporangium perillae]
MRRSVVPLGAVLAAVAVLLAQGSAVAEPRPTVAQAKVRLAKLEDKADQMVERYNTAAEKYKASKKKYEQLNDRLESELARVAVLRENLVSTAVGTYQSGDALSWPGFVNQPDPAAMLSGLAAGNQIAAGRERILREFDVATQGLRDRRTKAKGAYDESRDILEEVRGERKKVEKLVGEQERLLRRLDQFNPGNPNSPGVKYTGPASGNARVALQFAFAQIGKPYRWGATGPGSYDCSGFTQASWAKAGVSLPRTTYTQWAWGASRRVPLDALQPGDLLFSRGLGHMGMYVGDGKMIHAPRTGDVVKVVALDDYWRGRLLGAIRP